MRDLPIIFKAPMVLALLREADKAGSGKSQTRRPLYKPRKFKGALPASFTALRGHPLPRSPLLAVGQCWTLSGWQNVKPGDRLWVRENLERAQGGAWFYKADGRFIELPFSDPRVSAMVAWAHHKELGYAPSIHMPRWASRLTLVVTGTKIERLQDITGNDCGSEGLLQRGVGEGPGRLRLYGALPLVGGRFTYEGTSPRAAFEKLWRSINGDDAWASNPEVVALSFRAHLAHIDAMKAAA